MRETYVPLAICVLAATSCPACGETKPPEPVVDTQGVMKEEGARLVAFLDAQFEEELAQLPGRAPQLGRKDNYEKLNDISEAQQDRLCLGRVKPETVQSSPSGGSRIDADQVTTSARIV